MYAALTLVFLLGAAGGLEQAQVRLRADGRSVVSSLGALSEDSGVRLKCKHSRAAALEGVMAAVDTGGDGCLDRGELEHGFSSCLWFYERIAFSLGKFFGVVETPASILQRCDTNGDGKMCMSDAIATGAGCAAIDPENVAATATGTCLCVCDAIDGLFDYVISRSPC